MNIKVCFLVTVGLHLLPVGAFAQFYSAKSDSTRIRPYSIIKERKNAPIQKTKEIKVEVDQDEEQKEDSLKMLPKDEIQERVFGHLQDRLNVSLPLDFLKINSKYGHRPDPITRCRTFHDGVDLACNGERVYSMLPAVVKKVHRGNKGYGNYVILNHGNIECLYGHLQDITVKEKEVINAGTIVGISGNTGKSTGPHLHIRLKKNGKSVDPFVFIAFLRAYIRDLNTKLSDIVPLQEERRISSPITLRKVFAEILKNKILYPHIVLSQAVLETGYFSSRVCWEENNLFGLRKRNGEYYRFARWEDSVKAYRDYVQYKYKGGDYFQFLDRIGYAEDKNYTLKVRVVGEQLKDKYNHFGK